MALTGFLLRAGRLDRVLVDKILKAAWDAKGWPSERERREAHRDLEEIVRDTAQDIADGEPVVGGPTLEEMEPGMVRQLRTYWGWQREGEKEGQQPEKEERRSQGDRLIGYALEDVQCLFTDQHGAPHALVDGEPIPLNSRCYSLCSPTRQRASVSLRFRTSKLGQIFETPYHTQHAGAPAC